MIHRSSRRGIALLVTLMFVIVITIAIGYNLKQVKSASNIIQKERMLYQNGMILEDVLKILKNSQEIQDIAQRSSADDFYLFLSTTQMIPLQLASSNVTIAVSSARKRFNINEINPQNEAAIQEYFAKMMLSSAYVDVLKDFMGKVQEKKRYNNYNSVIFDENPYLFREYIASKDHLDIINNFYLHEYSDENIKNIQFEKLFRFSAESNERVDLNYATPEVLMLLLGTTKDRADTIYALPKPFKTLADMYLNRDERAILSKFKTSFFEPYLHIEITTQTEEQFGKISFDYDISLEKGTNFAFEI